ncbi:hypothetical protein BJ875DRAFT_480269 [Amylocarpus encephaloides]|uniref:Uncharacterized protein n=1 Tax=Amylocarpus encephaloides TaxID=45428 RepID=A0A9P8C987_9HELO|nr:hypothetical protein BJ875DRAFT_480269 [Amylocarpus encephaloides]
MPMGKRLTVIGLFPMGSIVLATSIATEAAFNTVLGQIKGNRHIISPNGDAPIFY